MANPQAADEPAPLTPPQLADVLRLHRLVALRVQQRAIRLRSLRASGTITEREFAGEIHRLTRIVTRANAVVAAELVEAPELGT
jgi:hypothetical protein